MSQEQYYTSSQEDIPCAQSSYDNANNNNEYTSSQESSYGYNYGNNAGVSSYFDNEAHSSSQYTSDSNNTITVYSSQGITFDNTQEILNRHPSVSSFGTEALNTFSNTSYYTTSVDSSSIGSLASFVVSDDHSPTIYSTQETNRLDDFNQSTQGSYYNSTQTHNVPYSFSNDSLYTNESQSQ